MLKSQIGLEIAFSNSIWLGIKKNWTKELVCRFEEFLRLVNNKLCYAFKSALSESITCKILHPWDSFFFQNIENFMLIPKIIKKIPQKIYGFLDNFISVRNCKFCLLLPEYRSCQSTCYQGVLKPHITLKITFSNLILPWTLKNEEKSTLLEISRVFRIC